MRACSGWSLKRESMNRNEKPLIQIVSAMVAGLLVVFGASCASNPKESIISFSGFLEDYSGFRPAPDASGAWTYQKPDVDLRPYTKVMIEPVEFWNHPDSNEETINPTELWQLKLNFQDIMVRALENGYTVVDKPGPDVLRLRTAFTEIRETRPHPHLRTPGPLLPQASDLLLKAGETLSSTRILVGEASLEAEISDSQTHERLVGYIEKRESSKIYVDKNPHNLVPFVEIFDYWAKKLRQRLDEAKKGKRISNSGTGRTR